MNEILFERDSDKCWLVRCRQQVDFVNDGERTKSVVKPASAPHNKFIQIHLANTSRTW